MSKPNLILNLILLLMIFGSSSFGYSPQFVDDDGSVKLQWNRKQIPVSISESLIKKTNNIKSNSDVLETIKKSLKTWEEVANIEFKLTISKENDVSDKESAGDGISLITIAQTADNLLLFGENLDEISAITRLFYNSKGEIKEADIVLNPISLFSTDGTFGSFDLEATLTHEIGHFIGLGHSKIFGSTMHSHQGKNGIYNLAGFSSRSLSDDDKAGAISLYEKRITNKLCCGKIGGQITNSNLNIGLQLQIWLEDSITGRVVAGTLSDTDGNYLIEGIPEATYKLYVQDDQGIFATKYIGKINLNNNQTKSFDKEINFEENNYSLNYLGLNGQLANIAVPVSAGKNYTIYLGGENLEIDDISIEFHTKNISVLKNSLLKHNYGSEISVISFEIQVDGSTPVGDYSFYLKKNKSMSKHIVGGLTVENSNTS